MRVIKIKNLQETADTYCSQEIQPGAYHQLSSEAERDLFASDAKVQNHLSNTPAKICVNDGDADLNYANGKAWLEKDVDEVSLDTPLDDEEAPLFKPKTTKPGWMQQFRCFNLKTAAWGSLVSKKPDNTNHSDCTLKFFDADNAEITAEENIGNAVRTQLDWEPPNDFDIAGGLVMVLETPTQDVWGFAVAVPDIAEAYGGSKVNLDGGFNMKGLVVGTPFRMDGRTPKRMFYSATYHTTKMRMIFRHAAGHQLALQIVFDSYKA